MRTFATSFLLVGALLAAAYAYPANSNKGISSDPSDDAEFIVVPLEHQRPSYINRYPSSFDGFDGVLDTDDFPHAQAGPVFFPSINPFSWQFSSYLDDLIKRVRDRFAGSWNPFLGGGGGDFVPSGPGLFPIDIPDVDDSAEGAQTNSTSTVKVIDGHKVIINDTYYTKKTDFGTSVFKVRVIDVKPVDSEEGGDADKPESGSTEKPAVETGNRSGTDADEEGDGKKEPTTEATPAKPRDTELDSSDEDTTPADDNLNTIDSNKDIDGPKKDEVNTEAMDAEATTAAPEE